MCGPLSWLRVFERVRFAKKVTFDASATPEVGKATKAALLTAVDVEALKADLQSVIASAEKDDPKILRRKITELERAASQAVPKDSEETKRRLTESESNVLRLTQSLSEAQLHCSTLQSYVSALQKIQVVAEAMQPLEPVAVSRPVRVMPPARVPMMLSDRLNILKNSSLTYGES